MKNQFKILCGAVALAMAGQVSAATKWTLTTGSVAGDNSAVTATSSGWANTGAGATIDKQLLESQTAGTNFQLWGGGLGINNFDGCSSGSTCDVGDQTPTTQPEHAIDNNQRYEMVLLSFGTALVNLTNANVGWIGSEFSSSWGSEYTVLAYTGSGNPGLSTKTWDDVKTSADWVKIGSYADATKASSGNTFSNSTYSSYWLIGAYNPLAGGTKTGLVAGNDALKLASVSGTVCTNGSGSSCTPGKVPEPGSLALFGLALLGMLTIRKRQQA